MSPWLFELLRAGSLCQIECWCKYLSWLKPKQLFGSGLFSDLELIKAPVKVANAKARMLETQRSAFVCKNVHSSLQAGNQFAADSVNSMLHAQYMFTC